MKAVAMSLDLVFAILILTFAIVIISEFGNISFRAPNREAQDIAVTFDETGVIWEDSTSIKHALTNLGLTANIVVKCYKYIGDTWQLTNVTYVYQINPSSVYWYKTVRYHNGELCTIDVGVKQ